MSDNMLGAAKVGEMVEKGVRASAFRDQVTQLEILRVLMYEGTLVDALAFVIGCMVKIAATLPPGSDAALAAGKSPSLGDTPEGAIASDSRLLFTAMLIDYLNDQPDVACAKFFMADTTVAAGAVSAALRAAGDRQRMVWAKLS